MQHILYQNYKEDQGSFKETLKSKAVEKAISLHPVKDPNYQYRIFNYLQSVKIMKLKQRQVSILLFVYVCFGFQLILCINVVYIDMSIYCVFVCMCGSYVELYIYR